MSLTVKDLTKIRVAIREEVEKVLEHKLDSRFTDFEEQIDTKLEIKIQENNKFLVTKEDFKILQQKIFDIQDIVIGIRNELDTEHEIRLFQLDNNTKQLEDHEVRIQTLEKSRTT